VGCSDAEQPIEPFVCKSMEGSPVMNRAKSLVFFICLAAISRSTLQAQNVVTDWNKIASTTIVATGGKASSTSSVWFAYTSIVVYDAVNAVQQEFQPFYYDAKAPQNASAEAAAVAAAHRVLVNYFPAQQAQLDAQLNDSLGKINVSADAKA